MTNHENRKVTHFAEKETPANNSNLINNGKQSVARSLQTNNFNQQKITNTDVSTAKHPLAIHTLTNCLPSHENREITQYAKKEPPVNNHSVTNRGKQSVACSVETNNFDRQEITNPDSPADNRPTLSNDSNIYLVQQVKNTTTETRNWSFSLND